MTLLSLPCRYLEQDASVQNLGLHCFSVSTLPCTHASSLVESYDARLLYLSMRQCAASHASIHVTYTPLHASSAREGLKGGGRAHVVTLAVRSLRAWRVCLCVCVCVCAVVFVRWLSTGAVGRARHD